MATTTFARKYVRGEVMELVEVSDGRTGLWNTTRQQWATGPYLGTTHAGFGQALDDMSDYLTEDGRVLMAAKLARVRR